MLDKPDTVSIRKLLVLALLMLNLSACSSSSYVIAAREAVTPTSMTSESKPTETPQAVKPTASSPVAPQDLPAQMVAAQIPEGESEALAEAPPAPQSGVNAADPNLDALEFIFPTPEPAPVSAWRPPLYSVPWAPTPFDHFYFTRPIAANEINWPLADYRYGGVFFEDVVHSGVDIPAPPGTPVLAAGPGKVTWAGWGLYAQKTDMNDPYGLAVAIKHDFGYEGETLYTVYGHMQKIFVAKGQHIEAGEKIGLVGDTGKTTGPHLHFEVRLGKNNFFGSRNPELWTAPPQGWGVLAGRVMGTSGYPLKGQLVQVRTLDGKQHWEAKSYGGKTVNSDPYYQENLVIGDIPAGKYEIWIPFLGRIFDMKIEIQPGMVTYFTFRGRNGYHVGLPAPPSASFAPPTAP